MVWEKKGGRNMNYMNQALFQQHAMEGETPVLVAFCASWCGYCRRILPALKRLAEHSRGKLLVGVLDNEMEPGLFRSEQIEVLLVDSASGDHTLAVMREFAANAPFDVKILSNPKKWLASGINIALREATGDAIIRLDAHARIPADFLQRKSNSGTAPDQSLPVQPT